jgi:hypothetical protein
MGAPGSRKLTWVWQAGRSPSDVLLVENNYTFQN